MRISCPSTALRLVLVGVLALLPTAGLARRSEPTPAPVATASQAQRSSVAPKLALLVGVNQYTVNHIPENDPRRDPAARPIKDLSGCENDVDDMTKLLTVSYSFTNNDADPAKDEIVALKSTEKLPARQATRAAILNSFQSQLIGKAKKYFESKPGMNPKDGATVVFYFSGHGSQTPDTNGDELDVGEAKWDETIVPQDSGLKDVFDIPDDEIEQLVSELMRYTHNITMIFDSCHSGTNTRDILDAAAKDVVPDMRRHPQKPLNVNAAERTVGDVSSAMLPRNKKYVAISGSLPQEKSYELPSTIRSENGGRPNGTLTFYLTHSLALNPNQTYREAVDNVYNSVQRILPFQSPQVEGDIDRPFLGTAGTSIRPSVKILGPLADSGKTMKIKAGEAEGVRKGSYVVVYDGTQGASTGDAGKLAHGDVTEAKMFESTVALTPVEGASRVVKETDRVVLVAPNLGTEPLRVSLDTSPRPAKSASATAGSAVAPKDAGAETMSEVQRILRQREEFEKIKLVEAKPVAKPLEQRNRAGWDIAVVRGTYKQFKEGLQMPQSKGDEPPDDQDGYYLTKLDGFPLNYFWLPAGDPAATAERLARALESRARQENVRALKNVASPLNGLVKIELVRLPGLRREGERAVGDDTPRICEVDQAGTPKVRLGEWFRFRITNTSPDRKHKVFVYLYNLGTSGSVSLLFPEPGLHQELKPGESIDTIRLDAGTPLGTEGFKLFVTTQKINAMLLESPGITERGEKGAGDTPLDRVLRSASAGTRDARGESFSLETWTTAEFEYVVTTNDSSYREAACPVAK